VGPLKRSSRQYLVSIHKWRSQIALFACVVTLLCSIVAINASMLYYVENDLQFSETFHYFTTLSNMLTALASSFIIPFAINGIRNKRFILPKWLSMLHYSGTICTTLVFFFAMVFILPYDREFAIGGNNFYLHLVCPIAVFISFLLVESRWRYSRREVLICLIPFILYSFVYVLMVVVKGAANGGWEDLYMLNTFVPIYVSFPALWLIAYGIAFLIKKLSDLLNRKREEKMFASWQKDADPVAVRIEIYGLGRYYGLHGDRYNLSVPLDILESVAEHYSMSAEELYGVYTKGLLHGIRERESLPR
jgi:hypothetical protein